MSAIQSDQPDQSAAAGLTLNLGSNNPFRNRAASPSTLSLPKSPTSPFDDPIPPRPVSRNPFLDPALQSPPNMATKVDKASPTAEEIFDSLTLDDKKSNPSSHGPMNGAPRGQPPPGRGGPPGPPRGENMPPPGRRGPPPPGHRPTRSQEEAMRARRMRENGGGRPADSSSPHRRMERRPRRNSESSIRDPDKPLTEEERKAKEARRRERERRHNEMRSKDKDKDGKDKKPQNRRMDIIDQLDATSIFGTGLFHHDGPFDALNPHRNRQGSRRAPMQAFPKDSLNNVIGGSGPLNKKPDHATFLGKGEDEAFKEFATNAGSEKPRIGGVFDPTSRGSVLHGDESLGLGTSTFLEGTPAARTVIQRREAEKVADVADGGLARKKSLAQRIRGMNRPGGRDFQPSGRMTNPEGAYAARRSPPINSPGYTSASMQSGNGERNPFFSEFDSSGKKGEELISVRRADTGGVRSPGSPDGGSNMQPLERRATTDAMSHEDGPSKQGGSSGGLLARVKSLKGGRRRDAPPAPPKEA